MFFSNFHCENELSKRKCNKMYKLNEDTICAVATKLGVGAISIIRVSGNDAIEKVNKIFQGKNLEEVDSHTIHYGYIKNGEEVLDEVLVSVMKAPKTFTREDVVEINCHGGILPTKKVLELLLQSGIRLADPGEFTRRAFLNGRIDLSQAEAVMELIESKNDTARKLALSSLRGSTSYLVKHFREKLKNIIASIEVNIDYPEYQDIEQMTAENLASLLLELKEKLEEIIQNSKNTQQIKEGIQTVIVGRPNVGKSSILNHLLEEEKAIVTSIEGTTRDVVEGEVNLDGLTLLMLDTAGIRKTDDVVEQIGVEKSRQLIEDSTLVLVVLDGSNPLQKEDKEILDAVRGKKTIILINKRDLCCKIDREEIPFEHVVYTDTISLGGLDTLKKEILKLFNLEQLDENNESILLNARQVALAEKAYQLLQTVTHSLESGVELDMISIDLKEILDTLGEITGDVYQDEILDTLFANFCVGK